MNIPNYTVAAMAIFTLHASNIFAADMVSSSASTNGLSASPLSAPNSLNKQTSDAPNNLSPAEMDDYVRDRLISSNLGALDSLQHLTEIGGFDFMLSKAIKNNHAVIQDHLNGKVPIEGEDHDETVSVLLGALDYADSLDTDRPKAERIQKVANAEKMFLKAADEDSALGYLALGALYSDTESDQHQLANVEQAEKWLLKAAKTTTVKSCGILKQYVDEALIKTNRSE